ncbi:MAG: AMP-binding protein [Acidimicrobiia bacterium]|nr:AMP-binding protein [Acidimicrobiia bacterium]
MDQMTDPVDTGLLETGLLDTGGMTLWERIRARADATPDKQFARDESDRTMTFGEFRERCEVVASGFLTFGIGAGSAVTWILPSTFESLVVAGALARLGARQNPILPIYRQREVGFIAQQSGTELFVVPRSYRGFDIAAMVEEVAAGVGAEVVVVEPTLPWGDPSSLPPFESAPDDQRWLFYSSGTTADPKGAIHTDASIAAASAGMQSGCSIGPTDRTAVVFPITHVGGLVWLFNAMHTGVELLMVEAFDPVGTPGWLSANGCTCAGAGTIFFQSYLAAQRALPDGEQLLPDVRIFNGGGAPKPPSLHGELMETFGAPLLNGWGLSEAPIVTMASVDDPDEKLALTEGRVVPGSELRVMLEGRVLGAGEEGELQVKGPQVCRGYLDSSLDADAFTDGWFRTGDLGIVDADGYVQITGRLKDIIIRKGENISAKEIEDVLHAHPKIADVAVVGLPDDERGERACAVIVTAGDDSITLAEMTAHLELSSVSRHKHPEQLEYVDGLPRNATGKILKKDLRARYHSSPG